MNAITPFDNWWSGPINIRSAAEAVRVGRVTPKQLVEASLATIERSEQDVAAWAHVDAERALRSAEEVTAKKRSGALAGIPVGVKDLIDVAGMPTTFGFSAYSGGPAPRDAGCVAALRREGAIILGKTVTTEFGLPTPSITRNPHGTSFTAGGSSSGSAAAVGAGMVPCTVGSQTGGSIILPAAFCGVVGYKPSFGWIGGNGVWALTTGVDAVGALGRSVPDVALLVGVMAGRSGLCALRPAQHPPRIGLCWTPHWQECDQSSQLLLKEAAETLRAHGAVVTDATLPESFRDLSHHFQLIAARDVARSLAHEWDYYGDVISDVARDFITKGQSVSAPAYDKSVEEAALARRALPEVFSSVDVLITPSVPGEAPQSLDTTGSSVFNRDWTLLHVPCVHLPVRRGLQGMPLGLQVVGPTGDDQRTLAAAEWISEQLASSTVPNNDGAT